MSSFRFVFTPPERYRPREILSFHLRDPRSESEATTDSGFRKAVLLKGRPACVDVDVGDGSIRVRLDAEADLGRDRAGCASLIERMLCLRADMDGFDRRFARHPQLGPLIASRPRLLVPTAFSVFEAVSWAIAGQQISVKAALSLRRNLVRLAGTTHHNGMLCHPDAAAVARLDEDALGGAGFFRTKARALLQAARLTVSGELPLETPAAVPPPQDIARRLSAISGVGAWTVNYVLLRGYGHLDASLEGDAAVRRGLAALLRRERVDAEETEAWLRQFAPWRTLAAAHIWAMLSDKGF